MITKDQVYEALHERYDPEIPVNIVDLGLVYDVEINDDKVAVKMTLTAPGCGMGTMIAADAKEKIMALDGVGDRSEERRVGEGSSRSGRWGMGETSCGGVW